MLEDERLVWRMKRGDRQALRRVYDKYKSRLLAIAGSMLGGAGGAEDVLHDVFVSFAGGIRGFQLYGSLESYLTTCVINRVRDRFRRQRFEVVAIARVKHDISEVKRPDRAVMFSEQAQVLAEALAKIPFEQREVIVLHIKGGMKFKEIAAVQGVGVSTVQGRYRYGLEKLRSALRGEAIA